MRLSEEQIASLNRQGFLVLPDLFSGAEVDALRSRLPAVFADGHEGNIVERESGEVRPPEEGAGRQGAFREEVPSRVHRGGGEDQDQRGGRHGIPPFLPSGSVR